jgi:hypothetical protein
MHDAFTVSDTPIVAGLQDRVESLLIYGGFMLWFMVYNLELSNDPDNGIPTGESVLIARSSK